MLKAPRSRIARTAAGAAVGLAIAGALAACSSSSSAPAASGSASAPGGSASASSLAAALQQPTTLTWWAWAPQDKDLVTAFEKQYPKVKVNLVNAGTGTTQYTKLQNAIKAGSGAPDIAQIEYYAVPQFALGGSLADLTS
jgi:multiple sugar transport system substrate-binding protein